MPSLLAEFEQRVSTVLQLAEIGEVIRARADEGSYARRALYPARLEALYEMAFLRIFANWESFLEGSFIRYLCGYAGSSGPLNLINPPYRTLLHAETAVLGGQDYVSWSKPASVVRRSQRFIRLGVHEVVVASTQARLEWFAAVRHRVAHQSSFSKQQFDTATMGLVGRRYAGASPGRFLRDWNRSTVPQERWIDSIGAELKGLARQIVP